MTIIMTTALIDLRYVASATNQMSNYSQYLLIKQLDVTTDPGKAKKRFAPQYFHTILKEVEDANQQKEE